MFTTSKALLNAIANLHNVEKSKIEKVSLGDGNYMFKIDTQVVANANVEYLGIFP